jgi:hypothetical protein
MSSKYQFILVLAASLSIAGASRAQTLESADTSASVPLTPVAVTTQTVTPVAVTTQTITPVAVVPIAVPVDAHQSEDVVTWSKLDGTVRSVDRNNQALTVQDREGKDVRVVYDKHMRIYRGGEQIGYSDVETNDRVSLRYDADRSRHDATN